MMKRLIDESLPRLPLKVLPIKLILKIGGRGKPTFKMETESPSESGGDGQRLIWGESAG